MNYLDLTVKDIANINQDFLIIFKKKWEFWSYSIELPRFDGKRHRKYKSGFSNYNDCQKEAFIAQNLAFNSFRGSTIQLEEFFAEFAPKYKSAVKFNSFKAFNTCFNIFRLFFNTQLPVKNITTGALQLSFENIAQAYKFTFA